MKWPDTLKQLMKEQGETQDTLAEKLGVSQSLLSSYFRGERTPPLKRLKQIGDQLGVSAQELLDDSKNNTNGNEIKANLKVKSTQLRFYPLLTIDEVLKWINSQYKSKPSRVIGMFYLADIPQHSSDCVIDLTDEIRRSGKEIGIFPTRRIYGIFKFSDHPEDEDIVIVQIDGDLMIRRYIKDGTRIKLKSFDNTNPDIYKTNKIKIIAIAKSVYNGSAEIKDL